MESNINYKGISEYSKAFSERICDRFFTGRDTIKGQEILSLCGLNQINLFVIMDIFQKWKEEVKKIKSPFFNYETAEVQAAMENLMNVLSRNIEISSTDFKPLLTRAVQQTILLVFSPYDFYRNEFFTRARTIAELKEETKFIKINSFLLKTVIEEAEKKHMKAIEGETALKIMNSSMEDTHETPEEFDPYLEQLSKVEPLNLDHIYFEQEVSSSAESLFLTVNDQFARGERPILADLQKNVRIDNIKNHITINQRFMFVNDLFHGKVDEFEMAVDNLETQPTYQNALEFLTSNFGEKNGWDMESETVLEFLDVVEKRYR